MPLVILVVYLRLDSSIVDYYSPEVSLDLTSVKDLSILSDLV